jgi:hypothetical protein
MGFGSPLFLLGLAGVPGEAGYTSLLAFWLGGASLESGGVTVTRVWRNANNLWHRSSG